MNLPRFKHLFFVVSLTCMACSSHKVKEGEAEAAVPASAPAVAPASASAEKADKSDANGAIKLVAPTVSATALVAPARASRTKKSEVSAAKSLGWLRNGNTRFVKRRLRKDGQSSKDVTRLSKGQVPHAIVLSCSDSRVPPEIVFDEKLGELFVVRTAGESLDDSVIASIESAVENLGPQLLVVMGHSSCGAVKAAVETLDGADAGSPSLNRLVADLHPRVREAYGKGPGSKGLAIESRANARGVAKDLTKRSAILLHAVQTGNLQIRPALYNLDSGVVDFDKL